MTLPDGTLIRGHLRFIAPDLNVIGDEDYIFGGESPAELCHGEFSITLVAPDATNITPTGWTYTVIAEFVNAPGWTRYIDITKDNPNVFLDDVIVLTPGDITNPDTVFVRKAGDTMTGALTLSGAPTQDLHAATKKYVDDHIPDTSDFVQRAGDTMTGELVLFGNPTVALGAAPKQYVDQAEADAVTAATAAAAAESVSLSGDTMTGPLILSGAPATGLGAATKDYADGVAAAAQAAAAAESVSLAGDTMTGQLVLFGDPTVPLAAATKQYVDALMHHMEEIVDDLDHGHGHGHHHGHGSELRHITKLLRIIEDDAHELVEEIERLERHASHRPVFSRPGIYLGGQGISFSFGN
jgi:hypothetical protein